MRSALAAKLADGKLTVVESFDLKEPKSKAFRESLGTLKVVTTALLVDGTAENKNLELSSRNLKGVELVKGFRGSSLPPAAIRHCDLLAARAGEVAGVAEGVRAQASGGGGVMKSPYQIIRKPVITEKGLAVKEREGTLVFQVAPSATKTEIKQAVQAIFKVKVDSVRTANFPGKERRRGKFVGFRPDWKKAYVRLKTGEKMPEYAQNL